MATSTSRWWALGALALSTLTVGLDGTILSVALPTLAHDLDATTSDLQWFTSVYLLVLAAVLLPAGMLGDRFGRKRMLIGALVLFGAASAACAYAGGTGQLIAARAVLGLGAAVLMPLSSAVLTVIFEPAERPRALTVWVTASALGIPLGPLVGGWLLDHFWWGSVFLINVPLALVAVVAVVLWVPESHGDRLRRFDPLGVLLSAVGLVALTYGVIDAGDRGWSNARPLSSVTAGVVVLGLFVLWQRRATAPLLDLGLFRSRAFTWGALLATVASFAMFGLLFTLPQLFQAVDGVDALGTGLRLLPLIGGLLVGARAAGRLSPKVAVAAGLTLMAAAMVMGSFTHPDTSYGVTAAWITVAGLGLGLTLTPSMNAALGALTPARSGVGSGLIQALRQVGSAIGVAVLGTVLNAGYRDALPAGLPDAARDSATRGVAVAGSSPLLEQVRAAFTDGMGRTLLVAAAVAVAGAVLALIFLPARPAAPRSPQQAPSLADSVV